ncbi:complex I NDUFA9 subunit family protein [Plastoroseomonas arctica]|uniref:Complex I NDUFA9 subunit family protein n=1 Tax=Plastoroseomonas arctica TaxID=1509237 RepID=A0AAF1KPT4_9PROT|nr:complex I NDUFA9 subunit family protein [Plastoroseomonas arctica]MBR0656458.1 complex I NDUFA9 subunit family protein [Plastoroseomonas arctica]
MRHVAVVFGGAGFIGRQVVQRLARAGFIVRVAGRSADGANRLQTQGGLGQLVQVRASITDEAGVTRAVADAEVVVNLVGILFERRQGDFHRLQAEGAGRIARLAAAAGVAKMVHLSAIGADAASPSLYARSKAEGEVLVRAGFPGATILRPSIVFGPEDGFFNRFAAMAASLPFIMPVVAGATRFQPVYVGDVADAVLAAIGRSEAQGVTYELGGPRVMTMREVLAYILAVTGRRRKLVDAPMGLMEFQAGILQHLPNPPITRDQLLLLRHDNVASEGAPGLAALGIEAKAVEAIVSGYLARYRVGGAKRPGYA